MAGMGKVITGTTHLLEVVVLAAVGMAVQVQRVKETPVAPVNLVRAESAVVVVAVKTHLVQTGLAVEPAQAVLAGLMV